MPINPKTQAKLNDIERGLVVELDAIGNHDKGQKTLLEMIERHLIGLFNALKQLQPELESRVVAGIRQYVGGYEQGRAAIKAAHDLDVAKKPLKRDTPKRDAHKESK